MAVTLFEIESVSAARGGEQILRDFSATLPEGASCIFGSSGAGKSTVLRLLNRLADPDSGVIRLAGQDLRELDVLALRRRVCLVPQLPSLIDGSVSDNLGFAAELARGSSRRFGSRGGAAPEVDFGHLLELAGLPAGYVSRSSKELSVGEQQRVMLARALALEPEVLLLDEPTSALDEASRDAIERTLTDLREQLGLSLVLVTHDPAQASRIAEWVVRIESGRVAEAGPADSILAGSV